MPGSPPRGYSGKPALARNHQDSRNFTRQMLNLLVTKFRLQKFVTYPSHDPHPVYMHYERNMSENPFRQRRKGSSFLNDNNNQSVKRRVLLVSSFVRGGERHTPLRYQNGVRQKLITRVVGSSVIAGTICAVSKTSKTSTKCARYQTNKQKKKLKTHAEQLLPITATRLL